MDSVKMYLRQWNVMRILRLVMGIVIIVQGYQANQWMIMGLGVLFTILPLLNMGCASGSCEVPNRQKH